MASNIVIHLLYYHSIYSKNKVGEVALLEDSYLDSTLSNLLLVNYPLSMIRL